MSQQQVFSGRYELARHIARGGMAQVYEARDLLLGRPVALKVLFPELSVDLSFVERFRREAQAAANLTHPNIVSVYDWGQGERTYFIVMEYVDGSTLSQQIRQGPIQAGRAAEIGAEVAAGLDFAHNHGVIHRDVKPGNVLIDKTGQVKVTDFGIARAVGATEGLTQTGSVMGTATYFSPEQAQGYPVDARSDVYSLGVVLYEMVVGHAPFAGENPLSIAYKHVREDPVPPTTQNRLVPPALEAVILKAMNKNPAERYQSAEELRADLLRFRAGQPVLAEAGVAATTALARGVGSPTPADPRGTTVNPIAGGVTSVINGRPTIVATEEEYGPAVPGGYRDGRDPDEIRRRRIIVALLAALALILLALGLYFGGKAAGWWGGSKSATIPTGLTGQPANVAVGKLHAAGFNHVTEKEQPSTAMNKGLVISTTPPGGTTHKTSTTVTVTVSNGPPLVVVPGVTGQEAAAATATLQKAGFHVTTVNAPSTTVNTGLVISTDPPGGQQAPEGSTVQITVSTGMPTKVIPSVAGDTPSAAAAALSALGFNPVQATEASSSTKAGLVIGTDPPSGTSAPINSQVTIYVSTGPAKVAVPAVTGLTLSAAEAQLRSAGLGYGVTYTSTNQPSQDGVVLDQNPSTGSVAAGSTIALTVGHYTAPTTTTTVPPPTTTTPPPSTTSTTTTPPASGGGTPPAP